MFLGVAVAMIATGGFGNQVVLALVLGTGVLLVVGLLDDLTDISPFTKLAGQMAGALTVIAVGAEVVQITVVVAIVAVAWIVLIANSVNLLDNMDGLAGSTSAASLMIMLPIVVATGQEGLALVTAAVIGAVVGFLMFNLNPAKVFMGDAGSLPLGLILAAVVAFADYGDRRFTPLVAITVLAVPLLDTATVVLSRLQHGFSIMHGGRDHLSHRLASLGLSDKQTVWTLAFAATICGLTAVGEVILPSSIWLVALGVLWAGLLILTAALLRIPVYQAGVSSSPIVPGDSPA